MLFFKTIAFLYLRYCFIILIALTGFMVGFDMMNNSEGLPHSANLLILYSLYKWLYALDMMLPITLVFAFIATIIELIRSNALTSFYALGYSRFKVLFPILTISISILFCYIAAHTTSFARANEYADNLRDSSQFLIPTNNLFFTHEGNYIYFGTLNPLTQQAHNIRVFTFHNGTLKEALSGEEAYYADHYWNIPNAHSLRPPEDLDLESSAVEIKDLKNIRVLHNFRPKILDQIYEGKVNYTIIDALDAMNLLEKQNIDLSKVKSSLYRNFVTPWFALIMIVVIYAVAPISPRFANLSLYSFGAILITLIVWGLLFMSGELANNKTLSPETGILVPIGLLGIFSTLYLSSFWIKSRINLIQKG
ncbi:MAG: LptF/LptG family permease [Sulfuricurvum sp.]|uniref:LptF/LptG family permease n=1 Tax=Sulfuricurvum sp. TaxID=2025608 RepID=UPI0026067803|nr:LptF/LptG family permease [Sulfuricurvum sp.]MDD2829752.1 LptF/LptG family permease [Sulfuricurvum sp.]MDD4948496.1 LptF/LptG family permease [Sulfuricurvum sp.]